MPLFLLLVTKALIYPKIMIEEAPSRDPRMKNLNEKYFAKPAGFVPEESLDSILEEGETILWRGKPKRSAFIAESVLRPSIFALIFLIFDAIFLTLVFVNFRESIPLPMIIFLCVFFLFHLLPVWVWIYSMVTASRRHKNEEYAFTEKRILVKKGFLGGSLESIYYSDLTSVNLHVGVLERIYKVGDIYLLSAGKRTVLEDVSDPSFLVTRLQKIAHDIKTDVFYPNDLRPEENHGYNTKYKG